MNRPLYEVMRPTDFDDLMQPLQIINSLRRMAMTGHLVNMLFYGDPGTGKTSVAHIMKRSLGDNWIEINGSLANGVDLIRKLQAAAFSYGIGDGPKVIFIDESEYLTTSAQAGLRAVIEKSHKTTRWLLAANDISRFHHALKSRCLPVCFDVFD